MRNSVGFFTCDEFCRICHNCDELGLIVHICEIFDRIPHVWYVQWDILHVIFSANIGVRNSVGFFTCDVFCPIYHNLYEFDRFFHICAVYHSNFHVWYNRSNILHVALSANIGVRNSVGFFTCDEFCRIYHNCDELGLTSHICDVFDRTPHVRYIQWDILHVIFSANIGVRNSVGFFTCDVFCRIYHDCDEFGGNFSQLWKIRWNYSSVLYFVRCQTGDTLSVNKGVRNSVAFFTCDVFCPISHNLYELGRFFHSRVVYHWISHVWHNRSNILHKTLSANIGVRNSVGFFTCDVFCWIWDKFVEFGQTVHICEVFDRIPHVWSIDTRSNRFGGVSVRTSTHNLCFRAVIRK